MPTVYARTLGRAAEIIGGEDALAKHLGVSPNQLAVWIHDLVAPPTAIFVLAADIVGQHELSKLRRPQSDIGNEPGRAN
ncbi:MAG TPA: hypothetical protein VNH16_13925 [Burkholderiales bacterium]|jgi:DNA-binding transcriptional regulator YdaS (Cro superfamily)|nr:hypothetical protein [Burkholderiales bacterium]